MKENYPTRWSCWKRFRQNQITMKNQRLFKKMQPFKLNSIRVNIYISAIERGCEKSARIKKKRKCNHLNWMKCELIFMKEASRVNENFRFWILILGRSELEWFWMSSPASWSKDGDYVYTSRWNTRGEKWIQNRRSISLCLSVSVSSPEEFLQLGWTIAE